MDFVLAGLSSSSCCQVNNCINGVFNIWPLGGTFLVYLQFNYSLLILFALWAGGPAWWIGRRKPTLVPKFVKTIFFPTSHPSKTEKRKEWVVFMAEACYQYSASDFCLFFWAHFCTCNTFLLNGCNCIWDIAQYFHCWNNNAATSVLKYKTNWTYHILSI